MRAAQRGGDGVAVRVDETIRVLEPGDGPFRFSVGMTREIGLSELPQAAADIVAGQIRGRVVVKIG